MCVNRLTFGMATVIFLTVGAEIDEMAAEELRRRRGRLVGGIIRQGALVRCRGGLAP